MGRLLRRFRRFDHADPGIDRAVGPARPFRAFELVAPEDVRLLVIGQDPYPRPGDATGLAFHSPRGVPPSMRNVYKALEATLALYSNVAIAWVGALVADLVINRPLGLRPQQMEFKRAHLYDINPVGVGAMLLFPDVPAALYGGAVLFGLSVGNVITFPALIVQREFPAAAFGVVIGLANAIAQFAFAFAPALLGIVHDLAGGYPPALILCIAVQLASAIVVLRR